MPALADISSSISSIAEIVCGYPLFILLIGGGLYLFLSSGMISLRRLPEALKEIRTKTSSGLGEISSAQALASVVAATIGVGNIAGVAIALVMGGPGAIFWMWVSALVGMATKYHEGVLAIMYRGTDNKGKVQGGTMHIIERGLGAKWKPLAVFFAVAGMFGTLCIMNANQMTEAFMSTFTTPGGIESSSVLTTVGSVLSISNATAFRFLFGCAIATVVAIVILGGIKRIATVASVLVPFMVMVYFLMVSYIIITNFDRLPDVFYRIFTEAFNLKAGFGALAGIAIIGARRAALVNDAGIGTATIMHGMSANNRPVREGLIAMLGPSIDSGLVCTLTAVAILLCGNIDVDGVKGLEVAMVAFRNAMPAGDYMLMFIVLCFGLSSMFSYSFYGTTCSSYLFGSKYALHYKTVFVLSLVIFAILPLEAVVGICDLSYAMMAIPTMITVLALSSKVREVTKQYFPSKQTFKNISQNA